MRERMIHRAKQFLFPQIDGEWYSSDFTEGTLAVMKTGKIGDYAACYCRIHGLYKEGFFILGHSSENNPSALKADILKTALSLKL